MIRIPSYNTPDQGEGDGEDGEQGREEDGEVKENGVHPTLETPVPIRDKDSSLVNESDNSNDVFDTERLSKPAR